MYVEIHPTPDRPLAASHPDDRLETKSRWVAEHGTTVFLGAAGRPSGQPPLIESHRQFEHTVVPLIPADSCLPSAVKGFFANGGRRCHVVSVAETLTGINAALQEGMGHQGALATVATLRDVSLICAPDVVRAHQLGLLDALSVTALQAELVDFCEMQGTVLAILDPLSDLRPQQIHEITAEARSSQHGAVYYPWLKPVGATTFVPPSGHVAGMFARADTTVGPHSAPLQLELRDVTEPAVDLHRNEIALLWPSGINPIASAGSGVALHSARTMSDLPEWRLVPWVRTVSLIIRNVTAGMGWTSRANAGDPRAWRQFGHDLEDLFGLLWRGGALAGAMRDDAFRVRCEPDPGPAADRPNRIEAQVQLSLQGPLSCALRIRCQLD